MYVKYVLMWKHHGNYSALNTKVVLDLLYGTDLSFINLKPNLRQEHGSTANRPKEEIDKWRESCQMTVSDQSPNPILKFDEVSFPNAIKSVIQQNNFVEPTPIQAQGWPIALSGRDMIGIAQTGSGKTLGFTLPGLIHINAQPPGNGGPIALCLCPTRELAQQVMEVCEQYTQAMRIRAVCLYGGSSKYQQIRQLAEGVEFAIATPGRLIDLLNTKKVSLRRCSYLVLDEADRMLDMGFEPQITAIISQIRPDRQTLMWSATWPTEVQELAQKFLQEPLQINIGSDKLVANHAIKQVVQVIEDFEKFDKLKVLLQQIANEDKCNKTLVFTDTKRMADDIADELKGSGLAMLNTYILAFYIISSYCFNLSPLFTMDMISFYANLLLLVDSNYFHFQLGSGVNARR